MIDVIKIIAIIICSYLIGNINASIIISHFKGGNIRNSGSGNPGTMNMVRTYGKLLGVLTLIIDGLKSAVCCVAACYVMGENPFSNDFFPFSDGDFSNRLPIYIAGISATVGHIYPVFMKFKGGKGIACIIGVNLITQPVFMLIMVVVGILLIILFKIGTFGSFSMIFIPIIYDVAATGGKDITVSLLIMFMVLVSLLAHKDNIVRLFRGRENLTYLFKPKTKKEKEDK